MGLLITLFVGAVAGWLSGLIMKGYGFGFIGNVVVGIVGALIASFVFPMLGISIGGGIVASILHATLGAILLLFVIGVITKKR